MRRSGYAFSFALAGLVFFSVPVLANPAPELPSEIDLSSTIAAEKSDAQAPSPDALAVKDDAADERKDFGKPSLLERAKAALAESDAPLLSNEEVCSTLVEVAQANELPIGFFTNLIWRESRFDHAAISRVGAMGIAQFMPDVADVLQLDAFDPREALPASGRLLRTLRARFGNLGLIAAAYNAGPKRVLDWLAARASLPTETRDYVKLITGRSIEAWRNAKAKTVVFDVPRQVPCHQTLTFSSIERTEREAQAQKLAEESRIMALSARKASLHQRQAGAAKSKAAHQRLNKLAQSKPR
jgi:soluble lytic murein transglycosylase-like protein